MQKQQFWLIIILANIVLAFIAISDPIHAINSDGVLYLQTATAYLQGGWRAAMRLYQWPFYSILIAWVSQICHCSLELAAYLINTIFQTLICLGFFSLACKARPINDTHKQLFMGFATLIILFYPTLNHHRDLIIRDFGYWAFSLWGWIYLIQLNENQRFVNGIQFNLAMLIASLFRLEGIIMLLFAPVLVFTTQQAPVIKKIAGCLKAYTVTLILFIAGLLYVYISSNGVNNLGRLLEIKTQIDEGVNLIWQQLWQAKYNIAHSVLTPNAIDSAGPLLVGGLVAVYIKMLIATLTPLYSVLLITSIWKKQFLPTSGAKPIIHVAIGLNILITIIFLMQALFLTERYLLELSFLLLLWLPFLLLWVYQQTHIPVGLQDANLGTEFTRDLNFFERENSKEYSLYFEDFPVQKNSKVDVKSDAQVRILKPDRYRQKPWIFSAVLAVIILIGLVSLHNFGPSKIYLKQTGYWLNQHSPKQGVIYTNNLQVGYYAQHPFVTWQNSENIQQIVQEARQKKYIYLVFEIKANNTLLKEQLTSLLGKPTKIFMNNKADSVWIYATM